MKLERVKLPGKGRPRNLVNMDTYEQCPCCGGVWKGGKPWSTTIVTAEEMAEHMGVSVQCITQKCRKGIIAAYQGAGMRWLIPILGSRENKGVIHQKEPI